jgi:ribokinase
VGAVVVTLGAQGAVIVTRDREIDVPAFPARPVDTTGAGDAFVGNLAHALEQGESLQDAVRFAAAAAALSVQKQGAQPSMPSLTETETYLKRAPLP